MLRLAEVARDEDERRRALERALDATQHATPIRARALVLARLGDVARDQHRDAVALGRWREALAADARCWPASLAIAEEQQGAGMPFVALARSRRCRATARRPARRRQWAALLDASDRRAEAERLLEGAGA